MTARAKDDDVSADLFGHVDDDRCRASRDQPGRDPDAWTSQACDGPLEQGFAVDPQAIAEVVAWNVGDAGIPRAAVPLGLGREDRQDLKSAPAGHVKLADVSRARADSEEPSIASSAFIRDSFDLMVERASASHTCRSQGRYGTLGPFDRSVLA